MHCIKMIMTPATSVDESQEEIREQLGYYFSSLYSNGQIYRNYELVKTGAGYCAFVTLPERDSLDDRYANVYVRDREQRVHKWFAVGFEYVGENSGYGELCTCENPSWYYLNGQLSEDSSPVVCGDCRRPRPLYRLPHIPHENRECYDFYPLQSWQRSYFSMDRLWFNGISDRFTYRQMNDPNSSLSRQGRELCGAFEKASGKPFYYLLFYYVKSSQKDTPCPICGKPWRRVKKDFFVDKRCKDCRLLARWYCSD